MLQFFLFQIGFFIEALIFKPHNIKDPSNAFKFLEEQLVFRQANLFLEKQVSEKCENYTLYRYVHK
jgi:hypothetical protein